MRETIKKPIRAVVAERIARAEERVLHCIPLDAVTPPEGDEDWFPWHCLDELPFSYGDTEHSLIAARSLAQAIEALMDPYEEENETMTEWLKAVEAMGDRLIDI